MRKDPFLKLGILGGLVTWIIVGMLEVSKFSDTFGIGIGLMIMIAGAAAETVKAIDRNTEAQNKLLENWLKEFGEE